MSYIRPDYKQSVFEFKNTHGIKMQWFKDFSLLNEQHTLTITHASIYELPSYKTIQIQSSLYT